MFVHSFDDQNSTSRVVGMEGTGESPKNRFIYIVSDLNDLRVGYNHAYERRPVTLADVDKVKSKKNSPFILAQARL